MRLGQLARKLAIRPSQLVDYLSARQVYFEEGSNAKLNDEYVRDIVTHFAPDRLMELLAIQKEEAEAEPMIEQKMLPELTTPEPAKIDDAGELVQDESPEKPEVIRAPKVELSGLKVVGKIDLPQPKKKETTSEPSTELSPEVKREDRPRQKHKKVERRERGESWQNPIALQREREAREKEAQRRAAIERAKEKKKEHYLKRVKGGQPTKPVRISDEPTEYYESTQQQAKPRTWWGRFMRWLNS